MWQAGGNSLLCSLALVLFGSNEDSVWGNAGETVQKASLAVETLAIHGLRLSAFYRTPAFPEGSGPPFVNAAAAFETTLSAPELLVVLHEIEREAGRHRTQRWGVRTLDLDLIALDDLVLPDAATHAAWRNLPLAEQMKTAPHELILPHPRMAERPFVLIPLNDVAPDWRHPVLGQSVAEMVAALSEAEKAPIVRLPT
ncbi:MAG: 2-amino-4-hydroxy-6-hydroxymethyldihydropteridine diphosphokinase [Pseudomonadota bacterium]